MPRSLNAATTIVKMNNLAYLWETVYKHNAPRMLSAELSGGVELWDLETLQL